MMSIPCTFENNTLRIKALRIEASGNNPEEALMKAIKSVPELYAELCLGKVEQDRHWFFITVPHSKKLYDRLLEIEPLPQDKPKVKKTGALKEAESDEVIKYGY